MLSPKGLCAGVLTVPPLHFMQQVQIEGPGGVHEGRAVWFFKNLFQLPALMKREIQPRTTTLKFCPFANLPAAPPNPQLPFKSKFKCLFRILAVSWYEERLQIIKCCHFRVFLAPSSVPKHLVLRELQSLSSQNRFYCLLCTHVFKRSFLCSDLPSTLFPG